MQHRQADRGHNTRGLSLLGQAIGGSGLRTPAATVAVVVCRRNAMTSHDGECEESQSSTIAYLAAVVIFFVSLALGCTIETHDLARVWKKQKRGVAIGWVSQFGFMPLFA